MKGLLFVAHGSRRAESNQEFKSMVASLLPRLDTSYTKVNASFLEFAMPGIDEALHAMIHEGITEITIYPFFLNSGKHVHHDIPEKIREVKGKYPEISIELLPHFGSSEHILSVITNDLKDL
jgi:sirohydrochlorin cobaltochelatase